MKMYQFVAVCFGLALSGFLFARPAHSDGLAQHWGVNLGMQSTAFTRAQHASEYTPQLVWNAWCSTGIPRLTLTSAGQYSTRDTMPFQIEDKANVGLAYQLNKNLSVYTFAEDRFRLIQWRYVAGLRLSFGG